MGKTGDPACRGPDPHVERAGSPGGAGPPETVKGWTPPGGRGGCWDWLRGGGASMVDAAGAAEAPGDEWAPAQALAGLLRFPPPRARPRPWWFPVQELRDPSALRWERGPAEQLSAVPSGFADRVWRQDAQLAALPSAANVPFKSSSSSPSTSESLFSCLGRDQAIIPEMEWMSQALLTVDTVNPGNLVKITIFGQPHVQNRVKSVLLGLASWHREHRARVQFKLLAVELQYWTESGSLPGLCVHTIPIYISIIVCNALYPNYGRTVPFQQNTSVLKTQERAELTLTTPNMLPCSQKLKSVHAMSNSQTQQSTLSGKSIRNEI
ncbi:hypothetical protein HPG69_001257 [Diceros bicornis minor]|uniref:KH-like RNA-binding domain-containing protein n=1 Tax=Diceros bicornis minor TaxID=77932 RepID=A0A7J7FFC5_DICBM|nr:hypothetical protein HPG69_001257 [Diceros bicornis minor]